MSDLSGERQPGVWMPPLSERAADFSRLLHALGVIRTEVGQLEPASRTEPIISVADGVESQVLSMGDQLGLIRVGKDNDDIIDLNPMPPEYRRLIHALVRRAGEPVSNDEFSLFFEDGEHTVEGFLLDVLADSTNVDGPLYPLVWRMRIDRAQQTCTFRAKDDG